ncbi:MAG: hypothetical protein JXR36_16245 [Bacteroidales bacterium]|nr:hypothetical protein [Bacteroidales bacterium]
MKFFISVVFLLFTVTAFSQTNLGENALQTNYTPGELVQIPGTSVTLVPPEHFLVSENIPGLLHPGSSTTVQVQEVIGTSYIMIDQAMTPEHFESQNVTLISKENVKMQNGMSGVLYLVEFTVKGYDYERIMLFAGDYNNTIWINANYPTSAKSLLYDVLVECLLTAQYTK